MAFTVLLYEREGCRDDQQQWGKKLTSLRVAVLRGALRALDEMRKLTPNTDCEHVGLGKGMKDVSQNFTLK